jgi:hypothetical protein
LAKAFIESGAEAPQSKRGRDFCWATAFAKRLDCGVFTAALRQPARIRSSGVDGFYSAAFPP